MPHRGPGVGTRVPGVPFHAGWRSGRPCAGGADRVSASLAAVGRRGEVKHLPSFPPVAIRLLLATDVEQRLHIWMFCPGDLAEQVEAPLTIGHQRRALELGGAEG
jgi:hypothetical protein